MNLRFKNWLSKFVVAIEKRKLDLVLLFRWYSEKIVYTIFNVDIISNRFVPAIFFLLQLVIELVGGIYICFLWLYNWRYEIYIIKLVFARYLLCYTMCEVIYIINQYLKISYSTKDVFFFLKLLLWKKTQNENKNGG